MLHALILAAGALAAAGAVEGADGPFPTTQEGPMRLVLTALAEQRVRFTEPGSNQSAPTFLRVQFKLQGADLNKVARVGNVIITELIDDAGHALADPNSYDQEKLNGSRTIDVNEAIVAQGGPAFVESFEVSTRGARKIKSLKGSLKVTYASAPVEVTFDNPLQWAGKELEHETLKKYGVRVRMIGPGQEGIPTDDKAVGLQVIEGRERLHGFEFYDDWMRLMQVRPRDMLTADGATYTAFRSAGPAFSEETQLVVKVFPEVRTEEMPIEHYNLDLP
ncbi:MAG TPA: hypothetical protein PKC49_12080 [Phycisphaerae bacterium]|nr:hypothetical protein [Phycisphaerae bacterium]